MFTTTVEERIIFVLCSGEVSVELKVFEKQNENTKLYARRSVQFSFSSRTDTTWCGRLAKKKASKRKEKTFFFSPLLVINDKWLQLQFSRVNVPTGRDSGKTLIKNLVVECEEKWKLRNAIAEIRIGAEESLMIGRMKRVVEWGKAKFLIRRNSFLRWSSRLSCRAQCSVEASRKFFQLHNSLNYTWNESYGRRWIFSRETKRIRHENECKLGGETKKKNLALIKLVKAFVESCEIIFISKKKFDECLGLKSF